MREKFLGEKNWLQEVFARKSFWVNERVSGWVMCIGEKYVQQEFLGEESLGEKYIVYWLKSMCKKSFWVKGMCKNNF